MWSCVMCIRHGAAANAYDMNVMIGTQATDRYRTDNAAACLRLAHEDGTLIQVVACLIGSPTEEEFPVHV